MGDTKNADKLKFTCTWPNCGYKFSHLAGTVNKVSAMAQCPNCSMFLPLSEGK